MNAGHPRAARTTSNEDAVTVTVEREPWRSSQGITREMGVKILHHTSPEAHISSQQRMATTGTHYG
jgi:hypothetical protein